MSAACCAHPEERHVEAGGIAYCLDCLAYLKHVHSYRADASDHDRGRTFVSEPQQCVGCGDAVVFSADPPDLFASASAPLWQAAAEMDGPDSFGGTDYPDPCPKCHSLPCQCVDTQVIPAGAGKPFVQRETVPVGYVVCPAWPCLHIHPERAPHCAICGRAPWNCKGHEKPSRPPAAPADTFAGNKFENCKPSEPAPHSRINARYRGTDDEGRGWYEHTGNEPAIITPSELERCWCGTAKIRDTNIDNPGDFVEFHGQMRCVRFDANNSKATIYPNVPDAPPEPERCRCGASTVGARVESNGVHQQHGVTGCGVVRTPAEVADALAGELKFIGAGRTVATIRAAVAHLRRVQERDDNAKEWAWVPVTPVEQELARMIAERDALAAKLLTAESERNVAVQMYDLTSKERTAALDKRDQLAVKVAELEADLLETQRGVASMAAVIETQRQGIETLTSKYQKAWTDADELLAINRALTAKLAASEEARRLAEDGLDVANARLLQCVDCWHPEALHGPDMHKFVPHATHQTEREKLRAAIADMRKRLAESGTYALCPSMRRTSFGIAQCMRPKGHVAVERNEHTDGTEYWRDEDAV